MSDSLHTTEDSLKQAIGIFFWGGGGGGYLRANSKNPDELQHSHLGLH